ncbi:hypothetical protein SeMB42_g07081 [Synchytrium endobioticum]|uniref:PX domain-containing protein n=1 Tax=Synchytrium endobioticum TaxID=286115 RepID=A0A507CTM4_9FUNG|nr:hypothetical protein SeMB42_g07081 [Synchytrium endobioticum]TPX42532.1 hypothetical protein SeLEV6574_g05547 [Synchytrium endobioticum]
MTTSPSPPHSKHDSSDDAHHQHHPSPPPFPARDLMTLSASRIRRRARLTAETFQSLTSFASSHAPSSTASTSDDTSDSTTPSCESDQDGRIHEKHDLQEGPTSTPPENSSTTKSATSPSHHELFIQDKKQRKWTRPTNAANKRNQLPPPSEFETIRAKILKRAPLSHPGTRNHLEETKPIAGMTFKQEEKLLSLLTGVPGRRPPSLILVSNVDPAPSDNDKKIVGFLRNVTDVDDQGPREATMVEGKNAERVTRDGMLVKEPVEIESLKGNQDTEVEIEDDMSEDNIGERPPTTYSTPTAEIQSVTPSRKSSTDDLPASPTRPSPSTKPTFSPPTRTPPNPTSSLQTKTPPKQTSSSQPTANVSIVPIYTAYAMYDFIPDPSAPEMLGLVEGEVVTVYGVDDVKNLLMAVEDGNDVPMKVEVSKGWCQVENAHGMVGFAPMAYLQFIKPESDTMDNADGNEALYERRSTTEPDSLYQLTSIFSESESLPSLGQLIFAPPPLIQPSPFSTMTNVAGLVTGKLTGSLRRMFVSLFSGNSLHDYVTSGGIGGVEGHAGGRSIQVVDESREVTDRHYITAGPRWQGTIGPFIVSVRRPLKRRTLDPKNALAIQEEFVTYRINSWFPDDNVTDTSAHTPNSAESYHLIMVDRRFKQLEWLHDCLVERFPQPSIILPPFPMKQYLVPNSNTRFDAARVERRRREIEIYLSTIIHHPVLRNEPAVLFFLSCGGEKRANIPGDVLDRELKKWVDDMLVFESMDPATGFDETEWNTGVVKFGTSRSGNNGKPPSLFGAGDVAANLFKRVYHPEFNVPEDGDPVLMDRFHTHLELFQKHAVPFLEAGQRHEAITESLSKQYSAMAKSLDGLARGTMADKDEDGRSMRASSWCWRQGCKECSMFAQGMVLAASHLNNISDLIHLQTKTNLFPFLTTLKSYSSLLTGYAPLIQMHNFASDRYDELMSHPPSTKPLRDATRARISTIFNVTLSEVERLHHERRVVVNKGMVDWLNQSIVSQENVLKELVKARDALSGRI